MDKTGSPVYYEQLGSIDSGKYKDYLDSNPEDTKVFEKNMCQMNEEYIKKYIMVASLMK